MDPTAQPVPSEASPADENNTTDESPQKADETSSESPVPSFVTQAVAPVSEQPIVATNEPSPSLDSPSSSETSVPSQDMESMPPKENEGKFGSGKKQGLLIGIVGFLLVIAVGGGIFLATKLSQKTPVEEEAPETAIETVTPTPAVVGAYTGFVEGNVWKTVGENKTTLAQGSQVPEKAIVETGDDGKITFTFDGGSLLYVGPGSVITIVSVEPSDMQFTLDKGIIYTFVDSTKTAKFSVVSGTAVISATGTAFSVEKDDLAGVNVYDSKVTITQAGTETAVEANKRWIEGSARPITLNTAELKTDNFLSWAILAEITRITSQTETTASPSASTTGSNAYLAALELLGIENSDLVKAAFLKTKIGKIKTITLTGQKNSDGTLKLSWTPDGLGESGFKIIWSETPTKPYPGDKKTSTPLFAYEKTIGPIKSGSTWYFRVCEWMGTTCGVYSNELPVSF